MKKGILAVALLAVVAVVVVGAMMFLRTGSSSIDADLKYLPSDCIAIGSAKVGEIIKSQTYKDIMAAAAKADPKSGDPGKEFEQNTGVALDNVVRATVGGSEKEDMLTVVLTTSKAVTGADLAGKMKKKKFTFANDKLEESLEARKFKEVKVGSHTLYEEEPADKNDLGDKMGFCVAEPTVVVMGKADAVKKVLERGKPAELTPAMKAALALPDQSRSAFVAVNFKSAMSAAGKGANPMGDMVQGVDKVEAVALDAAIAADAQLNVHAQCKDAADAESIKKTVDQLLGLAKLMAGGQMPPEVAKTLDSIKVENKGNRVLASATVRPADMIASATDLLFKQEIKTFEKVEGKIEIPEPKLPKFKDLEPNKD